MSLLGTSTVLFEDRTWRWFYEKHYRWEDPAADDRVVLGWVISDPTYRFISPVPHGEVTGEPQQLGDDTVHGPYRLECITHDSFEAVDAPTAEFRLAAWARGDGLEMPPPAIAELSRLTDAIRSATSLFWLQEFDPDCRALHSYLGPWAELLVIDRSRRVVDLVVASSD